MEVAAVQMMAELTNVQISLDSSKLARKTVLSKKDTTFDAETI